MNAILADVSPNRPPRLLTDGDQEVLHRWAVGAADLAAYVGMRRSDDPTIYHRIVISRRATRQRLYVIHASDALAFWTVQSAGEGEDVGRFPTLRAALHFIRPMGGKAA